MPYEALETDTGWVRKKDLRADWRPTRIGMPASQHSIALLGEFGRINAKSNRTERNILAVVHRLAFGEKPAT